MAAYFRVQLAANGADWVFACSLFVPGTGLDVVVWPGLVWSHLRPQERQKCDNLVSWSAEEVNSLVVVVAAATDEAEDRPPIKIDDDIRTGDEEMGGDSRRDSVEEY